MILLLFLGYPDTVQPQLVTAGPEIPTNVGTVSTWWEAEEALFGGTVDTEALVADFRGTGYLAGFTSVGDSVTFSVDAPSVGDYFVSIRYIHGAITAIPLQEQTSKRFDVSVNGQLITTVQFPVAESSFIWRNKSTLLSLQSGPNTIEYRLSIDSHQSDATQPPVYIDMLWFSQSVGNGIVDSPIQDLGQTIEVQKFLQFPTNGSGNPPRLNTLTTVDERIFVSEEYDGRIYELRQDEAGHRAAVLFLDVKAAIRQTTGRNLSNASNIHGGLRGIAFHPDFATNGKLYTSLMETRPVESTDHHYLSDAVAPVDVDSVLVEWTIDPATGMADSSTYREVFRVGMPFLDHPIKQIHFNPLAQLGDADYGLLYIGHGDASVQSSHAGGGLNNDALGKILRIDPLQNGAEPYTTPAANPYLNDDGWLDELYAVGFRNPHTFTFAQSPTGETILIVDDAGRDNIEEVNLVVAGGNYGWSRREGTFMHLAEGGIVEGVLPLRDDDAYNDYIYPAVQWGHTGPVGAGFVGQAIAGAHVIINGSPLNGQYIFADFAETGRIFHASFADMQDAITTLDPTVPQRDAPAMLTQATIGELAILFDHDKDPTTPPLPRSTMKDLIDDEPTYDGSGRADLRFGQGPNGELFILNKRNGWIYLATSTVPNANVSDEKRLFLPYIR